MGRLSTYPTNTTLTGAAKVVVVDPGPELIDVADLAADAGFTSRFTSTVNPDKYGAVVGAVSAAQATINTAAFQAAIDEACNAATWPNPVTTTRTASKRVEFSGIYYIDAPLLVRSVIGFEFVGAGFAQLNMTVNAASVLDLNGIAYSRIGGFTITGSAGVQVTNAIHTYWDSAGSARSNTANHFSDITIRNLDFVTGIRVGKPGVGAVDVSNNRFDHMIINGAWTTGNVTRYQNGMYIGQDIAGNLLCHFVYHLRCQSIRYGMQVSATHVAMFGGGFAGGEIAIYYNSLIGPSTFTSFRVEGHERMFTTSNVGSSAVPHITVADALFSADTLHADGEWIRLYCAGTVRLNNIKLTSAAAGITPKIRVSIGGAAHSSVLVDGLSVHGTDAPFAVADLFIPVGNAHIDVRSHDITNSAQSVTGFETYTYPVPASNQAPFVLEGTTVETAGTWTKPAGARRVTIGITAPSGGGGSGRRGADGAIRCGGGGGGGGGYTEIEYDADDLPAVMNCAAGGKGIGGAAVAVNDTDGNPGTAGVGNTWAINGATTYGVATSGGGGGAGTATSGTGGTAGIGIFGGAIGSVASATGGAGAASATAPGGGGGGAGGGITSANVESAGRAAGYTSAFAARNFAPGGAIGLPGGDTLGTTGAPVHPNTAIPGHGAGGGGACRTAAAGAGGNGAYGGGGGGGGASLNGFASGKGGDGSPGRIVITSRM